MKKLLFIVALASLFGFLALYPVYAQDQNVNVVFGQLKSGLLRSGVQVKDVNANVKVLKSLLSQGGIKSDLINTVLSLTKKGIVGRDLNISLESMSTLVKSGAKVNEAAKVVLQAIDQGLALGFKGGDLGLIAKVQEAVKKKQEQLLEEAKKKPQEEVKN